MNPIVADMKETRRADRVRRAVRFDHHEVWWEVRGELPAPLAVHDIAATALVHRAMHQGRDLHVLGPVTRSLLEGLEEYVGLWTAWRPGYYSRIDVTADEEVVTGPQRKEAIAAFSGGVDASFTLLRHAQKRAGRSTRPIRSAVLVQGLDIPLDADAPFAVAERTAREMLGSLGVPLSIVRTNWKRDVCFDWEMEFGIGVASCLRNWQGEVGFGLLGSDEDYARLVKPWGGHPLPYHLASSDDFQVVYDGGAHTRTQKVDLLSGWPAGAERLRVCWEDHSTGGNCGRCEKCIRTKLNFLAGGHPPPRCLGDAPTPAEIAGLRLRSEAHIRLMEEIVDEAASRNISAPWLDALRARIRRTRRVEAIKAMPLLAPARAAWRKLRGRFGRPSAVGA